MAHTMMRRPLLIGSEIYRASTYGRNHPLAIPRVSTALDLARALGAVPDGAYRDSPRATIDQLARFHTRAYLAALEEVERTQRVSDEVRRRHQIGAAGNPVFREILSRPATACGGTLLALDLLAEPGIVYNMGGGTHHGRADRASGFCYLNDPVLGILTLLDRGFRRVLYVDLDAHHCDGVQDALSHDERVRLISIHEAGRWPHTGAIEDSGGGFARNIPVPAGFNDTEQDFVMAHAVLPLARDFEPEILIVQAGADALEEDPLSRLALSNGALWRSVVALLEVAPRVLVLGGGGYNPWSVARCWAGLWLSLNGIEPPARLPPAAEAVLRAVTWSRSAGRNPPDPWFTTLADPPRDGPISDAVRQAVDTVTRRHIV
ncbi:MAG TPA: acetoin utilization protein AcuC [Stellaceae bacterium]|nr:acetoin utilization protein AcuC [Stellaceae bacterium]